jgi:hypothetical protein
MAYLREITPYGFKWGPVEVQRWCSDDKGGVVIGLITKRESVEIRVTPTGLIRVGAPVKRRP